MMIFDVNRYAQIYYQNIQPSPGNDYPRLKAWEFLYEYIWDESRPLWADLISEEHIDTTALHIGFYLANWGMFRGSSGLLQNSNLDLMKALAKCLFTGQGPELFELSLDNFAPAHRTWPITKPCWTGYWPPWRPWPPTSPGPIRSRPKS